MKGIVIFTLVVDGTPTISAVEFDNLLAADHAADAWLSAVQHNFLQKSHDVIAFAVARVK